MTGILYNLEKIRLVSRISARWLVAFPSGPGKLVVALVSNIISDTNVYK